ncbi:MAG: hypothetical protein V4772_07470, partial [Pseudomonadota bacterium]
MNRAPVAGALLWCLSVIPLVSFAAEAESEAIAKAETMVLRVSLNTEDKGDFFVMRTPDLHYWVKVEDMKTMGFKEPTGSILTLDGEPHISLRSMPGVGFAFDAKKLTLEITAAPRFLPTSTVDLRTARQNKGIRPTDNSLFLNYALSSSASSSVAGKNIGLSGELGWRLGNYLIMSNGNTTQDQDGRHKFVRLMSSVTHDDRENLQRSVMGDLFTAPREFSNGVNLGGISISKLYGLDPYFTRMPTQSISGSVATPSDLEVYLDGQRIRSEKLKPGEFELRDLLAYG